MTDQSSDLIENVAPDSLFLASDSGTYTYRDLYLFADYFQEFLAQHDIKRGQPIGLCAPSSDTLILVMASCWLQKIPFVSFNPGARNAELKQQFELLKPGCLITNKPGFYNNQFTFDVSRLKLGRSKNPDSKTRSRGYFSLKKTQGNIFGYFFTSGTSGQPKIVPLKRRQMVSAAQSAARNLSPEENEYWLLCLPLHHIGGVSVVLRSLLYGTAIYRLDNFNADEVMDRLMQNHQIVATSLVPTMLKRLIEKKDFKIHKAFKAVLLGGGPIQSELLKESIRRNIPVIPSYGMTETCAQIAANPLVEGPPETEKLHSVGPVFKPNEIEIRDYKNNLLPVGSTGMIWLKGPQVFDGYFQSSIDPIDRNGWFKTGDYGHIDKEEHLFIEARRTDLIITGGENVSPYEVEKALESIEEIKEAAVLGLPDSEWGQKIVACLVSAKGKEITATRIKKRLKKKLEAYKIPKEIIYVGHLPRTPTGKVKRSDLAEFYKKENHQSK